jgi:indole-3-glycerol phosphate synthase
MALERFGVLLIIAASFAAVESFSPQWKTGVSCNSKSALHAIGVLARKAKEMEIKKYMESMEDGTSEKLQQMRDGLESVTLSSEAGPFQQALTKRKGTITVIAEYRRKLTDSGFVNEVFDPELLSPTFREFGASGVAILADTRMGGCDYDDIELFAKEQQSAKGDMPGPVTVLNTDLIVDEVQIARSAAFGASAVLFNCGLLGSDEAKLIQFIKSAAALDMESVVAVSSREQSQAAVNAGASILLVTGLDSDSTDIVNEKFAIVSELDIPEGRPPLCVGAAVSNSAEDKEEIEEAWKCRDIGFNFVLVADALYRGGADPTEHCGAVIRSMKAKSSVKWASAKNLSGKGEGAREYLGDIMM